MALSLLAGCGGGGGGGSAQAPAAPPADYLTLSDVQRVIAQAVAESQARGVPAHVAVVDRVGNVLAVFRMTGATRGLVLSSGLGVVGGLDGLDLGTPFAPHAAISKAATAAYLSSGGNAFSTRTASQIIQENFNPGEAQQPSGPLYGVQFSQLGCSDVIRLPTAGSLGPKPSPLGLAADPGGLPLYKGGILVGGVGVEIDGRYGLDRNVFDLDENPEELVAVAGTFGFAAPQDIRANRITADGRTLRFVDSEALVSDPGQAPEFAALPGALELVPGYSVTGARAGSEYGTPESGIRPSPAGGAWILVDAGNRNVYPPATTSHTDLTVAEVQALLDEAYAVARRARAQIRRPLGSAAEVTIAVVAPGGDILGLVRTPDGPVFGIDVSVQKARTATFFSDARLLASLDAMASPAYQPPAPPVHLPDYVYAARNFLGDPSAFAGTMAWSARAVGNLHRPFFPDGIAGTIQGPFSTPIGRWSPLNAGLQLDMVYNRLTQSVLDPGASGNCLDVMAPPARSGDLAYFPARNGIQVFPGGVPIYRGNRLVGAIGVSGDGVDQDDMIAFLGVHNAGLRLASGVGNAPAAMRADRLTPQGTRLRYVQCPQSPFLDSSEQDACADK